MLGANQRNLSPMPGKWHIGQEPMLRPECRLDPGAPDVDEIRARDREVWLPDVSNLYPQAFSPRFNNLFQIVRMFFLASLRRSR